MANLTKNEIKAKLSLLVSLANITESLGADIELLLTQDNLDLESSVEDLIHEIKTHETKNVEAIMQCLENWGALSQLEDGNPSPNMYAELDELGNLEIGIQYQDGEKLTAFLSVGDEDNDFYQAGAIYRTKSDTCIDLAYAEIKKGEIAKEAGLPSNNKDIDVYTFGNVFQEDCTHTCRLLHKDILNALGEEEEPSEAETPPVLK